MPGPWYRVMPNPGTTRTVNNVSEFDTAYAQSIGGDKIVMNAGTYTMERTITKANLQIHGNGHVTIDGKLFMNNPNGWYVGLEMTRPSTTVAGGNTVGGDNVSIINCWLHHYLDPNSGGAVALLNPVGNGGTLLYGSVFHDTRHVTYLQNTILENRCWAAHCYIGDVNPAGEPGNAYGAMVYSSSNALNVRNWSFHENIIANTLNLTGADGNAEIVHSMDWKNNRFFRATMRCWGKPLECNITDNHFYENWNETDSSTGRILQLDRIHGQGEFSFSYTHPSTFSGNLVYKPNDVNNYTYDYRTDRYGSAGHDPGVALIRTEDVFDNNQFYGTFRANCWANNVNTQNILTLANWRAATLAAGNQYDTNSTFTAGVPPNNYIIWQNEYNPDRAMIAAFIYTGSTISVTLPRAGDIYNIKDQWGTAAYSGGSSYNVAPQGTTKAFFGIIKYTGGAMAQFARPSSDFNNPGTFTNQAGGSTNIYQTIDETIADDADFIQSPVAPTSTKVYVTKLSTITDPVSSSGHVIRWRYNKDAAGGAQINITAELRQGYVSEGSLGTLIKSDAITNVTDTFVTSTVTLSSGEADSITNYGDLYIRFLVTQV